MSAVATVQRNSGDGVVGSRAGLWTGRILTGIVALFLIVDGLAKMAGFAPYVEGTVRYGFDADLVPWIGAALVVSTALYVLPRTAVVGAILLVGYLGGAVATHVRAGEPWFFAFTMGVLVWVALVLRDARARALVIDPLLRTRR